MQLGSGLSGEGENGHVGRFGHSGQTLVSDASGENSRLAGPGSGDDGEKRSVRRDGSSLVRIEVEQKVVGCDGRIGDVVAFGRVHAIIVGGRWRLLSGQER